MPEIDKTESVGRPHVTRSAREIQEWIVAHVATKLQTAPARIRLDEPLMDIGLDSMEFVALIGELEQWLDCRFRENPLSEYPTIPALSAFLSEELAAGRRIIVAGAGQI
jgi:acyl carrier protein